MMCVGDCGYKVEVSGIMYFICSGLFKSETTGSDLQLSQCQLIVLNGSLGNMDRGKTDNIGLVYFNGCYLINTGFCFEEFVIKIIGNLVQYSSAVDKFLTVPSYRLNLPEFKI